MFIYTIFCALVVIYEAPSALENTNPYYMKRVFSDFRDAPTSVDWSHDSKYVVVVHIMVQISGLLVVTQVLS